MVKFPVGPAINRMTRITFLAEFAFMDIIVGVAGGAALWDALVAFPQVAIAAQHALVSSVQIEFSLRVIELKILPGNFNMATVALTPQFLFVWFLLFVAVVTFMRCFAVFFV